MSPALNAELRCSVVLSRQDTLLLVRRDRAGGQTWVLPGDNPEPGEGTACCTRREVLEETGLSVDVIRCAFVLEAITPDRANRTLEIVFLRSELRGNVAPRSREPDLHPEFVPLERLHDLRLLRRWPTTSAISGGHERTQRRSWATCGVPGPLGPARGGCPGRARP